jgi:hypothetical protein
VCQKEDEEEEEEEEKGKKNHWKHQLNYYVRPLHFHATMKKKTNCKNGFSFNKNIFIKQMLLPIETPTARFSEIRVLGR